MFGLSTILHFLGGVVIRLLPEVLHLFTAKQDALKAAADQAHELAMYKLQADHEAVMAEKNIVANQVQQDTEWIKAVSRQEPSGIRWIDGMNALVRPAITFWFFGLYAVIKMLAAGKAVWLHGTQALLGLWSPLDADMLASILGYWFADRTIGKRGQR